MAQITEAESRDVDKLGNPQHGNQQSAITIVSVAHGTASFGDVNTALDLLGVAINDLRLAMQAGGYIAGTT